MQGETVGEVSTEATFDVLVEFINRLLCTAEVDAIDGLMSTDISFSHFRTLMVLAGRARALSLNELSEVLGLSLAATGRNVDKLVGLGLVDRREDPADRRVKRVSLTDEGQHKVSEHLDSKEDEFRNFLDRLPAALRNDLHSALSSIVTGDYLADPDPVFTHRRQKANR
ncbi:MarR family winged helix-turn-helix transcriptional regulator [Williamsia deligens]|uniref:MarR family winged helix-turn-helix transcriptional regulator n=1 Tax=Williamsia deligens TaxID=321325 RepID=A0ABW3G664_9NOCA|nr:MarR family transcriptional regulator [Williamsia deligens]